MHFVVSGSLDTVDRNFCGRGHIVALALPLQPFELGEGALQPPVVQGLVFEDDVESVLVGNGVALDDFAVVVVQDDSSFSKNSCSFIRAHPPDPQMLAPKRRQGLKANPSRNQPAQPGCPKGLITRTEP